MEQKHFQGVLQAFQGYRRHSTSVLMSKLKATKVLQGDKLLQKQVMERLKAHLALINYNAHFFMKIIAEHPVFLPEEMSVTSVPETAVPLDQDKVRSTLKQFVRDWAAEGKEERDATYNPILDELETLYGDVPFKERGKLRVLVPGAGLGRLVFEGNPAGLTAVVSRGYSCQGNEFSFYMLLASNYILNQVKEPFSIPIFPWIHQYRQGAAA
ncbi:hypothetical protein HDU91_001256 [Kappamyces sp. JEL0680]|nr:hypothetical protein HDU91_001256 [Kappamyces sp. JEL0680]